MIATKSQTRGDSSWGRKKRLAARSGRPRSTMIIVVATRRENAVVASARRVIGVRHFAFVSRRTAETRVPP